MLAEDPFKTLTHVLSTFMASLNAVIINENVVFALYSIYTPNISKEIALILHVINSFHRSL